MRALTSTPSAWTQYEYWEKTDKKILKRINILIENTLENPFLGIGKPEPLKGSLNGFWSRRITGEHRLVYQVFDKEVRIIQCRYHY